LWRAFSLTAGDVVPLQYEKRSQWRLSRRWVFVAVVAALAYVVTTIIQAKIPQRIMSMYWSGQCAAYTAPAGQVVYELHNRQDLPWASPALQKWLVPPDPSGLRRILPAPRCLANFAYDGYTDVAPILFLGRLRARDGSENTIMLDPPITLAPAKPAELFSIRDYIAANDLPLEVDVSSWGALDPMNDGRYSKRSIASFQIIRSPGSPGFDDRMFFGYADTYRFYAGQRDARDPSRFTADFDADRLRYRLHCTLLDSSHLHVRLELPESAASSQPDH
jgi:hypothetical protein